MGDVQHESLSDLSSICSDSGVPVGVFNSMSEQGWTCGKFAVGTSSTAQGGGGSFKNRKPIGEIDCCESPMTEQKHWWIELSNYLAD